MCDDESFFMTLRTIVNSFLVENVENALDLGTYLFSRHMSPVLIGFKLSSLNIFLCKFLRRKKNVKSVLKKISRFCVFQQFYLNWFNSFIYQSFQEKFHYKSKADKRRII